MQWNLLCVCRFFTGRWTVRTKRKELRFSSDQKPTWDWRTWPVTHTTWWSCLPSTQRETVRSASPEGGALFRPVSCTNHHHRHYNPIQTWSHHRPPTPAQTFKGSTVNLTADSQGQYVHFNTVFFTMQKQANTWSNVGACGVISPLHHSH